MDHGTDGYTQYIEHNFFRMFPWYLREPCVK